MKTYTGRRDKLGNCIVRVIDGEGESHELPLRLDLFNHSPTGFEYGYGGSGPAQLALAILADALSAKGRSPSVNRSFDRIAVQLHQDFKWKMITPLKRDEPWKITQQQVLDFVTDNSRKKQGS